MADNNRKSRYKAVPNYIKNVGRSVTYGFVDHFKTIAPTISEYKENNSEISKSIVTDVRNFKSILSTTRTSIDQSSTMKAIREIRDNAMRDLKTGNLYDPEREAEYQMKAMGFDNLFDTSDFDDLERKGQMDTGTATMAKSVTVNQLATTKATISSINNIGTRIASATVTGADYVAQTQKELHRVSTVTQYRMHNEINQRLGEISAHVKGLFDFTHNMQTHFNMSSKYFGDSAQLLREMKALNQEYTEMQRNMYKGYTDSVNPTSKTKVNPIEDIIGAEGSINIAEYIKNIKKQAKDEWQNNLGGLLGFAGEDSNLMMGLAGSPLSFLPKLLANKMTPKDFEKSLKGLDKTLKNYATSGLLKLDNAGNESDNILIQLASKILGVKPDQKAAANPGVYVKGPVPFDGVTRQAIVEVIPTYLRKILSAVSNTPEQIYNYQTGHFSNVKAIKKAIKDNEANAYLPMGDIKSGMKSRLSSFVFEDEDSRRIMNDDLDKFIKTLVDKGVFFNPSKANYDKMRGRHGLELEGGEAMFNLLTAAFSGLDRETRMSANTNIYESRRKMKNISEENNKNMAMTGYGAMNNSSKADQFYDSNLPVMGGLLKATDEYNKTIFGYLRDLRTILLEGIKVYPFQVNQNARSRKQAGAKSYKYMDDRLTQYVEEARSLRQDSNSGAGDHSVYKSTPEQLKEQAKQLKGKMLGGISDVSGMNIASIMGVMASSMSGRTQEENDEKAAQRKKIEKTMRQYLGNKTVDTLMKLKQGGKSTIQLPGKAASGILDDVNDRLYESLYGKGSASIDGEREKVLDFSLNGLKKQLNKFSTYMTDKVLDPLHDKLFDNKKGIIPKLEKSLTPKFKGAYTKGMDFMFGRLDANNERQGGIATGVYDNIRDMVDQTNNFFTGKGYTSRVTGKKVDERKDNVMGNVKDFFKARTKWTMDSLFGEKFTETGFDANGEYIERTRRKGGLLTEALNSVKQSFTSFNKGLFGSENPDKQSAGKLYNEHIKDHLPKMGAGAIIGGITGLMGPFGIMGGMLIGSAAGYVTSSNKAKDWLFGEDLGDGNRKDNGVIKKQYVDAMKKYAPSMAGTASAGALASFFLPGGMLTWSFLGAGVGFAAKSDKFKNWLFGEENDDGTRKDNGVIKKQYVDSMKKYAPSMLGHGLVGAGAGMLLPGSMLLWSFMGAGVGFAAQSEKFKTWLFGEDDGDGKKKGGIITDEHMKKLKAAVPIAGIATVGGLAFQSSLGALGSLLLPGGVIGASVLGLGIGIASQTDSVKGFLFGEKDPETEKREGGLFGKLKLWTKFEILEPLKNKMSETFESIRHWGVKHILNPIKDSLDPVKAQFKIIAGQLKDQVKGLFKGMLSAADKTFEKSFGKPFSKVMNDYFMDPLKKLSSKLFGGIGKAIGAIISAPVKGLNGLAMGFLDEQRKQNVATYFDQWKKDKKERDEAEKIKHAEKKFSNKEKKQRTKDMSEILREYDYDMANPYVKQAVHNHKFGKGLKDGFGNIKPPEVEAIDTNTTETKKGFDRTVDILNNIYSIFTGKVKDRFKRKKGSDDSVDYDPFIYEGEETTHSPKDSKIKNLIDNARKKANETKEKAKNEFDKWKNDIGDKGNDLLEGVNDKLDNILTTISKGANNEGGGPSYTGKTKKRKPRRNRRNRRSNNNRQPNTQGNGNKGSSSDGEAATGDDPDDDRLDDIRDMDHHDPIQKSASKKPTSTTKIMQVTAITDMSLTLSRIDKNVQDIRDEVHGQLHGVGYHTEMVSNILVEQFGLPSVMPGLFKSGRGNKKGKGLFGKFTGFLKSLVTAPLNALLKVAAVPIKMISNLVTGTLNIIGKVTTEVVKLPGRILGAVAAAGNVLVQGLKPIAAAAVGVVKTSFNALNTIIKGVGGAIYGVTKGIGKAVGELAYGVGHFTASMIKGVGEITLGITKMTMKAIPAFVGVLADAGKAVWTFTKTITKGVWNIATSPFKFLAGKLGMNGETKKKYSVTITKIADTDFNKRQDKMVSLLSDIKTIMSQPNFGICCCGKDGTPGDGVSERVQRPSTTGPAGGGMRMGGPGFLQFFGAGAEAATAGTKKKGNVFSKITSLFKGGGEETKEDKPEAKPAEVTAPKSPVKDVKNILSEQAIRAKESIEAKFRSIQTVSAETVPKIYSLMQKDSASRFGFLGKLLGFASTLLIPFLKTAMKLFTHLWDGIRTGSLLAKLAKLLPVGGLGGKGGPTVAGAGAGGKGGKGGKGGAGGAAGKAAAAGGMLAGLPIVGKFFGGKKGGTPTPGGGGRGNVIPFPGGSSGATAPKKGFKLPKMGGPIGAALTGGALIGGLMLGGDTVNEKVMGSESENQSLVQTVGEGVVTYGVNSKIREVKKNAIGKGVESSLDVIGKAFKSNPAQAMKDIATKMAPTIAQKVGPKAAARVAALSTGAVTGGITTGILLGSDAIFGAMDTNKIFQLPADYSPTFSMRRAATLANMVDNNITFGTVPIKSIAEVIYNALGDEKDEETLSQAQGQFTNELNKYNEGKSKKDQLTANQYNKKVNANFMDKGIDKVKEWGSSAWEGTKSVGKKIADVTGSVTGSVVEGAKSFGSGVATFAGNTWNGAKKVGSSIADGAGKAYNGAKKFVTTGTPFAAFNDKEVHKQLGLKDGVELNFSDRVSVAQGKFIEMITGGLIDSDDASKTTKGFLLQIEDSAKELWGDASKKFKDFKDSTVKNVGLGIKTADITMGTYFGMKDDKGNSISLSKGISNKWNGFTEEVSRVTGDIATLTKETWKGIGKDISKWTTDTIDWVGKAPGKMDDYFGNLFGLKDESGNPMKLSDAISGKLRSWGDAVGNVAKDVAKGFGDMWDSMKKETGGFVKDVTSSIGKGLENLNSTFGNWFNLKDSSGKSSLTGGISNAVSSGISWGAEKVEQGANWVGDKFNQGMNALGGLFGGANDRQQQDANQRNGNTSRAGNGLGARDCIGEECNKLYGHRTGQAGNGPEDGVSTNPASGDIANGMVYYSQGDPRWASTMYGADTIKVAGCGPTSAAMVLSSFNNKAITPPETADWSVKHGHRVPGAGTAWSYWKAIGNAYGVNFEDAGSNKDRILQSLRDGKPVVMSGRGGKPFTSGGHFIVGRGVSPDGTKIIVNDPVSRERSIEYPTSTIFGSMRNAWVATKNGKGLSGSITTAPGVTMPDGQTMTAAAVQQKEPTLMDAFIQYGKYTAGLAESAMTGKEFDPSKYEPEVTAQGPAPNATSGPTGGVVGDIKPGQPTPYDMQPIGPQIGQTKRGNPVYRGNKGENIRDLKLGKEGFINLVAPQAIENQKNYNIPASTTIAQAIEESGWGKSTILNNVFGIKEGSTYKGPVINTKTHEGSGGGRVSIMDGFRGMTGINDGIINHGAKTIAGNPQWYSGVMTSDWQRSIDGLLPHYATVGDGYTQRLKTYVRQNNLTRFNTMPNTATQRAGNGGEGEDTSAPLNMEAPKIKVTNIYRQNKPTPEAPAAKPNTMDGSQINSFLSRTISRDADRMNKALTDSRIAKEYSTNMNHSQVLEVLERIAGNTDVIRDNTSEIAQKEHNIVVQNNVQTQNDSNNQDSNNSETPVNIMAVDANPFNVLTTQDRNSNPVQRGYLSAKNVAKGKKY